MVYAQFGGQTECIMGNWKIENDKSLNLDKKANPRRILGPVSRKSQ